MLLLLQIILFNATKYSISFCKRDTFSEECRTHTSISRPGYWHSQANHKSVPSVLPPRKSLFLGSLWIQVWLWIPVAPFKPPWEGATVQTEILDLMAANKNPYIRPRDVTSVEERLHTLLMLKHTQWRRDTSSTVGWPTGRVLPVF